MSLAWFRRNVDHVWPWGRDASCLPHVPLNRPLGDLDADFQQLATDPFGAPEAIVRCHLLDQRDRLHGIFGS